MRTNEDDQHRRTAESSERMAGKDRGRGGGLYTEKCNLPVAGILPTAFPSEMNKTVHGCGAGTVEVLCDLTEPGMSVW